MNEKLKPFLARAKECYEIKELERLGLSPDLDQRNLILTFLSLILKWNRAAGLVSPKDEENLFVRHFCDSIQPLLLFGFKKDAKILDIGTGAGFPSIPIRIFRPDLNFTLLESNRKKASFLREAITELQFHNITVLNKRTEQLKSTGEKYDYVLCRGVGSLCKIAQLAKPFVAPDGRIYTFKTRQFEKELAEITQNKTKDGICISEIAEYDLGNQILGLNLVSLSLL